MRSIKVLFVSFLVALVTACASPVYTDYETQHDFSAYDSYDWAGTDITKDAYEEFGGDIFDTRLKRAVDSVLGNKGMSDGDQAQFSIKYHLVTKERAYTTDNFNYGNFYMWNHPFYHAMYHPSPFYNRFYMGNRFFMGGQQRVRYYTVGTLTMQVEDKASGKVVWSSKARTIMSKKRTPGESEEKIQEMATKMFAEFPPNNVITL